MWIKSKDAGLINLQTIESISIVPKREAGDIIAISAANYSQNGENKYIIFSGSLDECEITMAEIEATIVAKAPLLEL
ncbi:MAG: hypothetical protein DWQ10_00470 [Calditrichaeota bacterium]|nr:MAG: hypothetical protein DWQ10_00470 [Calditrichota bacterium]